MQRISIERYRDDSGICEVQLDDGPVDVVPITSEWSGLVEGVRDDGTTWIMYLDAAGSPLLFWAERGEGGEVLGEPISLQPGVDVERTE